MHTNHDVAGAAALCICESIMLCLGDGNTLPKNEVVGVLENAADVHLNAPEDDGMIDMHEAVAAMKNGILAGGSSVRRRK